MTIAQPKTFFKTTIATATLSLLVACASTPTASEITAKTKSGVIENTALNAAVNAQSADAQLRFSSRNPAQTLNFFGVTPGMTVVEVLPGGGWYSKILLPYLGNDGQLVGVDYPQALWPNFDWMTPERIEEKKTWVDTWTTQAQEWRGTDSAHVSAFQFAEMPVSVAGTADAVLYIRALHNLARFDAKQGFLGDALQDTYSVLKPGGIVGIVQHQAREDRPEDWANGDNGYLKKSFVITRMQDAGFEFVGESSVNENPKDQANVGDIVWRLPPSYSGSRDNETKKAAMTAIGESNRMTLKFRKPS
jgi:predicted methyltransferase